ncbi:hypothetical protein OG417_25155 [Actinoallomurus sp. NBC_01490]|uniref:hypothetical protein n=1 Tax=Actinoallomurus sp. NBC_01490 TaxID=2903557 RepID=UPI002E33C353|nr:hypothetical protein [Actinoallomurus sp. NBC_01490]
MTAIPWTVVDPDTIERMIAVGLCRRHKHARRIKPSQGDGGLDVLVPVPGRSQLQVENYQVKKFADGLNDSRKRQIEKSLTRAIATHNETTFGYRIFKWYLALPMDLTREQEKWLFDLASDLKAPFPVEVFGLTSIEELLLESPNIRDYYLGEGLERVREALAQISNLAGLQGITADPEKLEPANATDSLAELHHRLNAADPHFNYDYQVTMELPRITPGPGLIASVIGRAGRDAPHVTWHVYTKYDSALEDRPIPGGYTVYPERMSSEQRKAWERWRDYGTPVVLEGDVLEDFTLDMPGGLGEPLPAGDHMLEIGPALGEFEDEPTTRSLWVIEDAEGASLAERMFSFRLKGRGLAGGEYRHGVDADGYITVDFYAMPTGATTGSMKVGLNLLGDRWAGEPVQRVLPMLRFCAAWGNDNLLRPRDEFGLTVAKEAFTLSGESPIPSVLVAAVEDLVRISAATKRPIGLPQNIGALANQKGIGLRVIADTVSGLEPEVGIGELVLWYEDEPSAYADLAARAEAKSLVVPWSIPFPLLGDDFKFAFSLEISGDVTLEPEETTTNQPKTKKAVRVVPAESTRGRLRWAADPTSSRAED